MLLLLLLLLLLLFAPSVAKEGAAVVKNDNVGKINAARLPLLFVKVEEGREDDDEEEDKSARGAQARQRRSALGEDISLSLSSPGVCVYLLFSFSLFSFVSYLGLQIFLHLLARHPLFLKFQISAFLYAHTNNSSS